MKNMFFCVYKNIFVYAFVLENISNYDQHFKLPYRINLTLSLLHRQTPTIQIKYMCEEILIKMSIKACLDYNMNSNANLT